MAPARLSEEPLLVREEGSATRQVTERTLERAGVRWRVGMELHHTEAIKQAVMAGLGVAFVSVHAVRGEVASRRLASVRLRGLRIRRHFRVSHSEARTLSAGAQAFGAMLLEQAEVAPGRARAAPTTRRSEQEEKDMTQGQCAFVGLIAWLWPSVAAAQDRPYEWGWGMHPMWGMWGVWGIGMMLMTLVFWGAVIVGIVLAIRWLVTQGRGSRATDPALDILRQRYARGDISKEEFEAKKKDLA